MSYSGTVHCGHCYDRGHNKTNCPKMRREAAENPDSWQAHKIAEIKLRKARPKICSYCDESGHTRAGCEIVKRHKVTFTNDATLWRLALVKWMKDIQLGIGALVRCRDAQYHDSKHGYVYATDESHIPPVGMIMKGVHGDLNHYHGIMNAPNWMSASSMLSFQRIGASNDEPDYQKTIGITLPCVPGIVPRYGKGYYGNEKMDRVDRLNNVDWEVVSPGQTDFSNDAFVCAKSIKKTAKEHFKAPNEQTERSFHTFAPFQKAQLKEYVNDEIELSEMKDPEVPGIDT